MRLRLAATFAVVALGAGAAVAADAPANPSGLGVPAQGTQGYLAPGALDTIAILPPAPTPGTPRYEADRRVFRATRALKGTPRWALATADVDETAIMQDFSCSAGAVLGPAASPKLMALLLRMRVDVANAVTAPKMFYKRRRPYLIDPGPICVAKTDLLAQSPDYPSGHTSWGWSVGLMLAEADPAHATAILARARSYGESRIICGVHNMSAIEAGRTNGAAVVAALHGSRAFRDDLDAVRAEITTLQAAGPKPDPAACAVEAALIAKSPLVP